jgi:hypothetical protein
VRAKDRVRIVKMESVRHEAPEAATEAEKGT